VLCTHRSQVLKGVVRGGRGAQAPTHVACAGAHDLGDPVLDPVVRLDPLEIFTHLGPLLEPLAAQLLGALDAGDARWRNRAPLPLGHLLHAAERAAPVATRAVILAATPVHARALAGRCARWALRRASERD